LSAFGDDDPDAPKIIRLHFVRDEVNSVAAQSEIEKPARNCPDRD
jgi:hypothetical protein